MNVSTESDTKQGTLSELAERLGNIHESANALTTCLQTRDTTRKTDQSMLEAAKNIFSELLEETNDDLDRALTTTRRPTCPSRWERKPLFLCRDIEHKSLSSHGGQRLKIHCSHSETEDRSDPFLLQDNQPFA